MVASCLGEKSGCRFSGDAEDPWSIKRLGRGRNFPRRISTPRIRPPGGGSMENHRFAVSADHAAALHCAGELCRSFRHRRVSGSIHELHEPARTCRRPRAGGSRANVLPFTGNLRTAVPLFARMTCFPPDSSEMLFPSRPMPATADAPSSMMIQTEGIEKGIASFGHCTLGPRNQRTVMTHDIAPVRLPAQCWIRHPRLIQLPSMKER